MILNLSFLIIFLHQLNLYQANNVYVIRRDLKNYPISYDITSHSALLLEISSEYFIVEYLEKNNGTVQTSKVELNQTNTTIIQQGEFEWHQEIGYKIENNITVEKVSEAMSQIMKSKNYDFNIHNSLMAQLATRWYFYWFTDGELFEHLNEIRIIVNKYRDSFCDDDEFYYERNNYKGCVNRDECDFERSNYHRLIVKNHECVSCDKGYVVEGHEDPQGKYRYECIECANDLTAEFDDQYCTSNCCRDRWPCDVNEWMIINHNCTYKPKDNKDDKELLTQKFLAK